MTRSGQGIKKRLEKALARRKRKSFVLHLYVAGLAPRSQRAIENVRRLCEEHLRGRYALAVHDIYEDPSLAREGQILAAPTLIKELPPPLRRFVGDMSRAERLLVGMDIRSGR